MAGRKSDFTLPTLDELFTTQELRDDAKLSKIRDIPLELIDDFPGHPFKVRDDEDTLKRYAGYDKDSGYYILEYENEARYPGKTIKVRSFQVQGVARHVIKSL